MKQVLNFIGNLQKWIFRMEATTSDNREARTTKYEQIREDLFAVKKPFENPFIANYRKCKHVIILGQIICAKATDRLSLTVRNLTTRTTQTQVVLSFRVAGRTFRMLVCFTTQQTQRQRSKEYSSLMKRIRLFGVSTNAYFWPFQRREHIIHSVL